ncbi:serine/threonine-protein kinase [Paenibacillus silvisoli]|uniref:serine/threonine-protein kinase n=1 Tax=Paenibacillus silvisoli TaxID=3110539 RepID=UPI0028041FD5|nr:serine/threonine-protein kinase [Paenibacillus silvisoli]
MKLESGTIIGGRYRVVRQIGQGGMGEVYAAEDMKLHGKLRALKVTSSAVGREQDRSAEEAAILMRLNHPHLPLIIDYFSSMEGDVDCGFGCEIMVMDFIDGMTLQAYSAASNGVLESAEAIIAIGVQLCEALRYLHVQQPPIIHRDLKPTNVMIDSTGFVRLIDFGIAREFKAGKRQDTVMLGTPGFSAPEQEGDNQSDARTDVYGLGALLYYLLTGGRKYDAQLGVRAPSTTISPIPSELTAVLNRMLDERPACRFGSMAEAKRALETCLKEPSDRLIGGSLAKPGITSDRNLKRKRSIMVASFSPGAGATFVTITLAHLLDQKGLSCAAIEYPELEPEWHALLYERQQPRQSSHSFTAQPWPGKYRSVLSKSRRLQWYALEPDPKPDEAEAWLKYRFMLDGLACPVIITDVSSHWTTPELELQLTQCDRLILVVDPYVAKWTTQRLAAVDRIQYERRKANRPTYLIANKDVPFRRRSEWLSMLANRPICSVPSLPPEQWADLLWSGEWATSHKAWQPMLGRAFQPLLRELAALWSHDSE